MCLFETFARYEKAVLLSAAAACECELAAGTCEVTPPSPPPPHQSRPDAEEEDRRAGTLAAHP